MPLIYLPNKKLRKKSQTVVFPLSNEDEAIVKEMIDHITDSKKPESDLREGIGIAAIQLGYLKRMFYIDVKHQGETYREFLINPEIIGESDTYAALEDGEGCLSVDETKMPGEGLVHRKFKISVKGYSYFQKKEIEITKSGMLAIVLQHELDHLMGKLFLDRIDNKDKWLEKENEEII